ncbi:polymer-forming cytoskeletal protein [Gorillibacterium timonense]|uniref:polymer-forming cytoskeletal protein n=1 Tax=Gorillibacterium timonense TaxID=1689269 RepID=UPI00071D2416|nr:polymer-forming cytoskeletal protein [Gorillibacterium timonense]
MKKLASQKGNALLLVLAFVLVMVLLIMPVLALASEGQLQTLTDGHNEAAFVKAESAARVYKDLFEKAFARMESDSTRTTPITVDDVAVLAQETAAALQHANLYPWLTISADAIPADGGVPAISFTASSGSGPQKRAKAIVLQISTEQETVSNPAEGAFYIQHGVVSNNTRVNHLFEDVSSELTPPGYRFIENDYPADKYTAEFKDYMSRYTGSSFDEKFSKRPLPLAPLSFDAAYQPFPDSPLGTVDKVYSRPGGTGLLNASKVTLKETEFDGSYVITPAPGGNGVAIKSSGDVVFPGSIKNTTIEGDLLVGGNLLAEQGNTKLVIKGNVKVNGDMRLGSFTDLIIEGNVEVRGSLTTGAFHNSLIVKGDLIVHGSETKIGQIATLTVQGDFLTKGDVTFTGSVDNEAQVGGDLITNKNFTAAGNMKVLDVQGALSSKLSMKFGTVDYLSVGRWSTMAASDSSYKSGTIVGNDRQSIVSGTEFRYGHIGFLRATRDFSCETFTSASEISMLRLGGSLLTGNDIKIPSTAAYWLIDGDISVGQKLNFEYITNVTVKGSIFAGEEFMFTNVATDFHVGGSILSPGNISFYEIRNGSMGSILSRKAISFRTITSLQIAETIAAGGDITFVAGIGNLKVAKDLISAGSLTISDNCDLSAEVKIGGMLAALKDISILNNLHPGTTFGGFYSGGNVTFASWNTASGSNRPAENYLKINHKAPEAQSVSRITISTKWSSRVTYAAP